MKHNAALILVITGNLIWGGSFMFSKIALDYADPVVLLALRFTTAFLSMLLVSVLFGQHRQFKLSFKGKNLKPLIMLSIFQPITYFYFEAYGLKMTSTVISSVTIATVPIVAIFFESFRHRVKVPKDKLFYSCVSVGGVALVAIAGKSTGETSFLGFMALVMAVSTTIAFDFLSQKISSDFSAYERTFFMFMSGALFYDAVILFKTGGSLKMILAPMQNMEFNISILYLGVLSSVVAFTFINQGLSVLSISETTVYNTLITIVGVLCGMFILGETAEPLKVTGCVVIILGLLGFNRTYAKNKN